jgi:hypothetical protein
MRPVPREPAALLAVFGHDRAHLLVLSVVQIQAVRQGADAALLEDREAIPEQMRVTAL